MTIHSSFQNLGSRWVALYPEPKGVIQFIGGAFFGAPPSVTYFLGAISSYFPTLPLVSYHFLLENLLRAGYSIVVVPYLLTVNHWSVARQLLAEQQQLPSELLKVVETLGYATSPYQNPENYLWVGHSLGCEYITLLRSLSWQSKPSGNPEPLEPILAIENQPALLIAPCFQPPAWLKFSKQPTQALARQLLVETARRAPTAMISFNQDFTAGNLTSQTGDVYWIQTSFQGVNTEEPSETATSLCLGSTVAGDSLENPGAVTEFDAFESNPTAQLFASINGQPLPNLFSHRQSCRDQNTTGEIIVEAPGGYQVSTEEDGFLTRLFTTLSLPVGLEHTTVSDGYVVMLEPLSTGTYLFNFGNSDGDESTFVLTVNEKVPEPTSTLNLFVLGIGGIASALTSKLKHRAG